MENVKLVLEIDIKNLTTAQIMEQKRKIIEKVFTRSLDKNLVVQYQKAVGLDNKYMLKSYTQPSDDIGNRVDYFIDKSVTVFEINYPKNHIESINTFCEYKGKDFLVGFKKFLQKTLPFTTVYIKSTEAEAEADEYEEGTLFKNILRHALGVDFNDVWKAEIVVEMPDGITLFDLGVMKDNLVNALNLLYSAQIDLDTFYVEYELLDNFELGLNTVAIHIRIS